MFKEVFGISDTLKMAQEDMGSGIPKVNNIKGVGNAVKNTVDLSIMKSVPARVRSRLAELKELSGAKHQKVQHGNMKKWYTTPPKMFIGNLDASVSNNRGVITYDVYKMNKDGNKVIDSQIVETEDVAGNKIKQNIGSSYIVEKSVIETIEYRKPMKVEEMRE